MSIDHDDRAPRDEAPCPIQAALDADDPIGALDAALRLAGARATFDSRRSTELPCWLCNTESQERDLVEIGRYTRPMGGNLRPGDAITRPLCARCRELTEQAELRTPRDADDQPLPTPSTATPIIDLVLADVTDERVRADLRARSELGIRRYGQPLRAHNGRDVRRDAYQEALDGVMYLRQEAEEATDAHERAEILADYRDQIRIATRIRERMATRATEAK